MTAKKTMMMSTTMNNAMLQWRHCYAGNEKSPSRLLTDSAVTELAMVGVEKVWGLTVFVASIVCTSLSYAAQLVVMLRF